MDPERTAARRAAIADAAAGLFATRGFDRTSAADIARAAGISSGSVFSYVADKQAVFRSIFEQDVVRVGELVERHSGAASPLAAILAIVEEQAGEAREPGATGLMVELLRRIGHDAQLQLVGETAAILNGGLAWLVQRASDAGEIVADLACEQTAETAS